GRVGGGVEDLPHSNDVVCPRFSNSAALPSMRAESLYRDYHRRCLLFVGERGRTPWRPAFFRALAAAKLRRFAVAGTSGTLTAHFEDLAKRFVVEREGVQDFGIEMPGPRALVAA